MADELQNKAKIRFKFRSGDEFEAEGNPDFIEKQRADFLQLIGKDSSRTNKRGISPFISVREEGDFSPVTGPTSTSHLQEGKQSSVPTEYPPQMAKSNNIPSPNTAEPAFYRRTTPTHPATTSGHIDRPLPPPPMLEDNPAYARLHPKSPSITDAERKLWEQIIRTDDKLVYLRRKSRQISPDTAAIVLLAAAKVLLGATDGYSALLLSKALKKSGYGGERLDRVLAGEMRQGLVSSDGTKRSRLYLLSDEGFARAYVLATKLFDEWRL